MSNNLDTIMTSVSDHCTTPIGWAGQEGELSIFRCSCGKEFFPTGDSNSRAWPSLPAIHKALEIDIALGNSPVFGTTDTTTAPNGSVFIDHQGVLYRKKQPQRWVSQGTREGVTTFNTDPNSALVAHVWSPVPEHTTDRR